MAKPKSSNRSVRLADEMWAWLAAEAERRQTSVNGLVGDLLLVARFNADERTATVAEKPKPPAKAKPPTATSGKIIGFTPTGEPIKAPAFVSRLKGQKR